MASYARFRSLITSGSTSTSAPYFVGDFTQIGLSWQSSASLGPSRFTVEGSHADGLQKSDLGGSTGTLNWSLVTGINLIGRPTGIEDMEPGYRWLRVTVPPANHSSVSAVVITLNAQA